MELFNVEDAKLHAENMCVAYEKSYGALKAGLDAMCKKHLGTIPRGTDEETGKGLCYDTCFWIQLLSVGFGLTHRPFPREDCLQDHRYCRPPAPLPDTPETRRDMAGFVWEARKLDQRGDWSEAVALYEKLVEELQNRQDTEYAQNCAQQIREKMKMAGDA